MGDRAAENPSDRHSPIVGIVRKKVLLSPQKCCICSKSTLPFIWIYFRTFYILFVFEFVFVSILLTRYNAAFFLCIFGIVQCVCEFVWTSICVDAMQGYTIL